MSQPAITTRGRPQEAWAILGLLTLALYVVYYRDFTRMGLYEDDWSAIAPYANGPWSLASSQVGTWLTHWPNGRPLGLSTCALAGWGLYHLGGLPALYLLPFSIVTACAWTIYRIIRDSLDLVPAFLGAITFALLPTDSLRLSLHGAPHLYLAALCMLLALRALQCRSEWAAAPLTFLGLLFHETSTLTLFLGPILVLAFTKESLGRSLRYWVYVCLGLFSVMLLRVFVFAEARAASTFSNLPQVIARSLTSLGTGTKTHWSLIVQRCREGFQVPVPGSAFALIFLLALFLLVFVWQWRRGPQIDAAATTGQVSPSAVLLFGLLAFGIPYVAYFTDPYWPANHVAGRMASVHSASGVGVAFGVAGLAGLLQQLPWKPAGAMLTVLGAVPLAALLAWGNVTRSQYLEAWQNERSSWRQMLGNLGDIKANTVIFSVRPTHETPPFTWVIGSSSWADAIVLRNIYEFPADWPREPRAFNLVGEWQKEIREHDGQLVWLMPVGDWPSADVTLEPGNLAIFTTVDGKLVPGEGAVEIGGHHLALMQPSHGRFPAFKTKPLFADLIEKVAK